MAQDLEGFEQGRSQRAVLPSRRLEYNLEEATLLGGGLLQEQLARPACQAQHVDGLIDWGWRGFLDILDVALQPVLLGAPRSRLLVEKLLGNPPIAPVQVHRLDSRLDLIVPGPQLLDSLRAARLLGPIGGEYIVIEPFEDGLRNDPFLQNSGELACENFLARVWLLAFSPVARAVVVHVLPLLQLADKQAAAVAAVDQSGIREIMLHFPRLVLGASIQQLLNTLPTFAGDQRLVRARVRASIPIEIAGVQPLSQYLVNDAAVELATTQLETFAVKFRHEHL